MPAERDRPLSARKRSHLTCGGAYLRRLALGNQGGHLSTGKRLPAFFPFADGLLVAIEAGATAVIQPGGSVRDDEVIKAADDHGIAMVFTGTRHFRH